MDGVRHLAVLLIGACELCAQVAALLGGQDSSPSSLLEQKQG